MGVIEKWRPEESERLPVCIVGAGPNGLIAARALKKLCIPFTILEKHSDVGGLWDIDNPGSPMYESCHYISAKNGSKYYDFPMPAEYPDYPSRTQIHDYIRSFADTYGLRDSVAFGRQVTRAEPEGDTWRVHTADGAVGHFGALIACTGSNWFPRMPELPGTFAGEVMHSVEFRSARQLEGKRALIVGLGNSGADIACDAARWARSVVVSMRRGYHFVPKHLFGVPTLDFFEDPDAAPEAASAMDLQAMVDVIVGDVTRLGFPKPDHQILETHPLLNTQILHYAAHGLITPKGDIRKIEGDTIWFEDGSCGNFDVIICATGYNYRVPFIDENQFGWTDGHPSFYMTAFCRQHPTLFVLGLLEAGGAPWSLGDQITLMIAEYLRDRYEAPERADAFAERIRTEQIDLKEGMAYVPSARTVNYVNIPTLRREVDRVRSELEYTQLYPGIYDELKAK